jgi:hypothetical protein
MAFWIFKGNPEKYRLADRLADPSPIITWTVTRFRDEIRPGDTVFLWETGANRGIRAVLRVDEPPRDIPELPSEQSFWVEPDRTVSCRILGTITHRGLDLPGEQLRHVPGLESLPVFHGFQQQTNSVTPEEGRILMRLIEHGGGLPEANGSSVPNPSTSPPAFQVGRVYNRRADIHGPYGGQQQGGISTPSRYRCIFLFSSPSGRQHGYQDGWNEEGV